MRLKKVKNALEKIEKSTYYVHNPQGYIGKWENLFGNSNPIHIEIGMGKGNFMIGMAKNHPEINYIGIEMYDSVLVKATEKMEGTEERLHNLKFILLDANHIDEVFEKEISRIYLNFSDPWPKKKHGKRRLTSSAFLEKYDKIFLGDKEIFLKTDNNDLFEYSMETLKEHGYLLKSISRDLHSEGNDDNIMTEYEAKFHQMGVKINRLEAYKS